MKNKKRGRPNKVKNAYTPFATRLRLLGSEMTNREISDGIGTSTQTVINLKNGNTRPDVDTLSKLADFFGVSADYLLGKTDIKKADIDLKGICDFIIYDDSTLKKALNKYGAAAQEDIAIEEMSELIKALLKYRRAGKLGQYSLSDTMSAIVEEVADVIICIEYLKLIYSQTAPDFCERVQKMIDYKIKRTKRRLDDEKGNHN